MPVSLSQTIGNSFSNRSVSFFQPFGFVFSEHGMFRATTWHVLGNNMACSGEQHAMFRKNETKRLEKGYQSLEKEVPIV